MCEDRFCQGVLIGVAVMVVLGFVFFWLNVWLKEVRTPFKPMSVVQTTKRTPWQVLMDGFIAVFTLFLFIVNGIVLVFLYFAPEKLDQLLARIF